MVVLIVRVMSDRLVFFSSGPDHLSIIWHNRGMETELK